MPLPPWPSITRVLRSLLFTRTDWGVSHRLGLTRFCSKARVSPSRSGYCESRSAGEEVDLLDVASYSVDTV